MEDAVQNETDALPTELPGILLESDYDTAHAITPSVTTEPDIVAAAMENDNLAYLPKSPRLQECMMDLPIPMLTLRPMMKGTMMHD